MSELKTLNTIDTSPFKRLVLNLGACPSAFTEGMTYYEVLAWLCNYIEKTLTPTINEDTEAIRQLQALYVELKEYVDNYFDNLDVQEEINNKLDAMAEDGTLDTIINQEIFGELNERVTSNTSNINETNIALDKKINGFKPNLMRDLVYDLTSTNYTQGAAMIGNKLYICQPTENNFGDIIILDAETKSYHDTIENVLIYHGGDVAAIGNKLYISPWNAEAGRKITVYDTTNNTTSQVNPFASASSKTTVGGLATFDETKLLCILTSTNLPNDDLSQNEYWIYDTVSGEVTELDWDNTANIYATNSLYATQGTACVGNHYYISTSLDNNLLDFYIDLENHKLILNSVMNLPYYDNSGLLIGEYEGLCNAESVFGEGALCATAHVIDNGTGKRTLKTYIINPIHNTPNFEFATSTDITIDGDRLLIYVDPASSSLYEDGTSTYPYKTLCRGIAASQSKNIRSIKNEVIIKSETAQNLYGGDIKDVDNLTIGFEGNVAHHVYVNRFIHANVAIGANTSYVNKPTFHFGNYPAALNYGTVVCSNIKIHDCNIVSDGDRVVVQEASQIHMASINSVACSGSTYMLIRGGSILYDATPAITFGGTSPNPLAYYMEQGSTLYVRGSTYTSSDVGDLNSTNKIRISPTSCQVFFPYGS